MGSLVEELQAEAIKPAVAASDILRKAVVVATKLGVKEMREWIRSELDGYEQALPQRFVSGPGGDPMQTECSADLFGFAPVAGRAVVAGFDGGKMTSDAGALLLGATDRAIGLIERFAACFTDGRGAELTEHEVSTVVGQRVFGIALGYEDLVDHDQLRHDPTLAVLAGKLAARRKDCAPLAGKSTSTGWSWAGRR
jgi:hypothetical protein